MKRENDYWESLRPTKDKLVVLVISGVAIILLWTYFGLIAPGPNTFLQKFYMFWIYPPWASDHYLLLFGILVAIYLLYSLVPFLAYNIMQEVQRWKQKKSYW